MTALGIAFAVLFSFALYSEIREYRELLRQHVALCEEWARRARRE